MNEIINPSERTIMIAPGKIAPALCLDLDGTVRFSLSGDFINRPEDIALFHGVEEKIWTYRDNGFLILGVSNQAGVAHGFKTVRGQEAEIGATLKLFTRNPFHGVKVCYHDAKGSVPPFNHRSLCRKPNIGLLAIYESELWEAGYIVDWDNSLMVGDRNEDKQLAENAGIGFQWAWEFFGRKKP